MILHRRPVLVAAFALGLGFLMQSLVAADTSVGFGITNLGAGTYLYTWTINYSGETQAGAKFGALEVYFPGNMMAGSGPDLGSSQRIGTFDGSTLVTETKNAAFYGGPAGWSQSRIQLESPDQEGFDPPYSSEIDFNTNAADSAAALYTFTYKLDTYLATFHWELHDAREADTGGEWLSGTSEIPEPGTLALLFLGLPALAYLRRRTS